MFTEVPFTIDKIWNDRGVKKENVVHTYNGILLSYKKEQNNAILRNMDGPKSCHAEQSQTEKNKYCMIPLTYTWSLKKW